MSTYSQHTVLAAVAVGCPSNGCRASSSILDIPASPAKKMIPPPDIWGASFRKLTCGPTKLTYQGLCQLSQYKRFSCSDRMMSIQRLSCFFNLWSSCSSRPKQRRSCRVLLPPVAGCAAAEASQPPTIPTAGQALRRWQPHTAAEPVNPRTPLHTGFHCRVLPGSASSPS